MILLSLQLNAPPQFSVLNKRKPTEGDEQKTVSANTFTNYIITNEICTSFWITITFFKCL